MVYHVGLKLMLESHPIEQLQRFVSVVSRIIGRYITELDTRKSKHGDAGHCFSLCNTGMPAKIL